MLIGKLQALLEEQHKLVLLEQAARQRVAELSSTMESERNQNSVLKAIIHAKEANIIPGIYGRMGDLGAIDGEYTSILYVLQYFSLNLNVTKFDCVGEQQGFYIFYGKLVP